MDKKTLHDIEVREKRVLVRVDFNVPQDEAGAITDDTRIRAALPTLRHLMHHGARVIVMSHLGRPKGKTWQQRVDPKLRLDGVADRLSALLGRPVAKLGECVGPDVESAAEALSPGELLLLENVRFHAEEEANDAAFAGRLARLGEVFVNDAFGAAHRAHASTEGVARHLPGVAGFLMARELAKLGAVLNCPTHPFVTVLGGSKVSDKIGVIDNLLPQLDALLLGGGMAFTFLKAQGLEIGNSLLDAAHVEAAAETLSRAQREGRRIELPVDVVVTDDFKNPTFAETVSVDAIPVGQQGVDIGPETIRRFQEVLRTALTVVWNGPMGVFENPRFAQGTRAIAETLAEVSDGEANVIIGGGDSAAAVEQMGFAHRMDHVSTGGGATLEFLEGQTLPGVAALQDR